jgi:hypothetical protein
VCGIVPIFGVLVGPWERGIGLGSAALMAAFCILQAAPPDFTLLLQLCCYYCFTLCAV